MKENWELLKAWEMGYWETQWASVVFPNAFAHVLPTLSEEGAAQCLDIYLNNSRAGKKSKLC